MGSRRAGLGRGSGDFPPFAARIAFIFVSGGAIVVSRWGQLWRKRDHHHERRSSTDLPCARLQALVQGFDGTGVKSLCVIMSGEEGGKMGLEGMVKGVKRLQGIGGSVGEGVEISSWQEEERGVADSPAAAGGGNVSEDYALRLSRYR